MSSLPRVTEHTRERISREFDDLGPDACAAEIAEALRQNNPELLDMAAKCARDVGEQAEIMIGFVMFYRLLAAQCSALPRTGLSGAAPLDPLPRVTRQTRERVAAQIERQGPEAFTRSCIEELERSNPELLQMAHRFASSHGDYLGTMQGFGLFYASLVAQAAADRAQLH